MEKVGTCLPPGIIPYKIEEPIEIEPVIME